MKLRFFHEYQVRTLTLKERLGSKRSCVNVDN